MLMCLLKKEEHVAINDAPLIQLFIVYRHRNCNLPAVLHAWLRFASGTISACTKGGRPEHGICIHSGKAGNVLLCRLWCHIRLASQRCCPQTKCTMSSDHMSTSLAKYGELRAALCGGEEHADKEWGPHHP
jgi:hypothetical protein